MNARIIFIWFIATFFAFFQFFLQAAAGVLGGEWRRDFHLSNIELSNLSSAFFYTYALMQIPVGILFDHYSPRYILTIAAGILTIGCWWLAYTDEYQMAFFARLLMGIGSSFGFIGMLQICATYFSAKKFAMAIAVSEGFTMLTVTGSIMLLTWLVNTYSWRITIFGSGLITLLLMVVFFICFRDSPSGQHPIQHEKRSIKKIAQLLGRVLLDKQVILCSLYGFFMFSIVNAFTSLWGIPFLMETYSLSKQLAANITAMVFVGIAVGGPFCGWLAKILNQNRIILIMAAIFATMTMSLIIFYPHLPNVILFISLFLMGVFCSAYVQCFAVIKDSVSTNVRATALAASNMVIMLGAPILQLLIGYLLQGHIFSLVNDTNLAFRFSLAILPLGMLVAILIAYQIKDPESESGHHGTI